MGHPVGRRERPVALLVDFDGVLRQWDPRFTAAVEARHGLEPGALLAATFEPARLRTLTLGQVSHAAWLIEMGSALGAPAAVTEWAAFRGTVDPQVLAFVRSLRAAGHSVALATNASDLLDDDLAALELTGEFDAVVNSAVLGVAKPAPEFFAVACAMLRVPPKGCLLVDDTERNVQGARAAGLAGHRWTGPGDLPYLQAAFGLATS
jgi:putative hydrolase of the HAD superfamily